jgi:hypothetical protein
LCALLLRSARLERKIELRKKLSVLISIVSRRW